MMKCAWGPKIFDGAAWNTAQIEHIDLLDFEQMLIDDSEAVEWNKVLNTPWYDEEFDR